MERILKAAIHFENKVQWTITVKNLDTGIVVNGYSHSDCIHNAITKRVSVKLPQTEGFITNENRFVNREEAWGIALAAKQINPEDCIKQGSLSSPDLIKT